jgi:hypothetical protein
MKLIHNLEDVMFSIEECPIYCDMREARGLNQRIPIHGKKALIHPTNNTVLGVVGRDYEVVTNRDALDWAYQCCTTIFSETKAEEWTVQRIDASSTLSTCCMDLVHRTPTLDFSVKSTRYQPENYGPFVRVRNSFNGQRALSFHVGFYRKVCSNGMILRESLVSFRFNHVRHEIGYQPSFNVDPVRVIKMRAMLSQYIAILSDVRVTRLQFVPLVQVALGIHKPRNVDNDRNARQAWNILMTHLENIAERYSKEMGETAYAVLNTATEFASQPPTNRCLYRTRHSLQQEAGLWLSDFSNESQTSDFDLDTYIRSHQETVSTKPRNPRS